jgi:DNA-binding transcriptional regulator YhcF (GntR family)
VTEELRLRIDLDSDIPAYRQIVNTIRIMLVSGSLKPGAELPSVRRVARDLGVHFNTVAESYRILAEEGWLDLRHGRSARVVQRVVPQASPEALEDFQHRLRALMAEVIAKGTDPKNVAAEMARILSELYT